MPDVAVKRRVRDRPPHRHLAQRRRVFQVRQNRIIHRGASERHIRVGGELHPDIDNVPAFQDERATQWARIDAASFLTLEEKRRLAGLG